MFFAQNPDALTQLGWALKFYDISFLYAPTPQAKGKIEREHQFWQGRLPPYFASEEITDDRNCQSPHRRFAAPSQHSRNPSRTAHDPATRLGIRRERKALHPAPSPTMPLVALRLECSHYHQGRLRRPRSDRRPAPACRTSSAAPESFFASIPPAITPSWLRHPDQKEKPVLLFTNRPK